MRKRAKKAPTKRVDTIINNILATKQSGPNAVGHLHYADHLKDTAFSGSISTKEERLDAYSYDESIFSIKPQVIIQPASGRDVEIAVKIINEETKLFPTLSLTPRAAGTGLSGGSLTDSIVVDLVTNLNKIDEPKKAKDGVRITVEPGAMFRDVEKVLKRHNVYLPAFPASKDICAIGGCVGNNAAGPDSLNFGHFAESIASLDVVLKDGQTHTIAPLTYPEFKKLTAEKNAYADIATTIFKLIKENEALIKKARPKTTKNSAGYALWDVISSSVSDFEQGRGSFDLNRLICGSQGTIGIVTGITLKTEPIVTDTALIAVPIFDLGVTGQVILSALKNNPLNVELYDGLTFDLALKNPDFFKTRLPGVQYQQVVAALKKTYQIRYQGQIPEFTLLITLKTTGKEDKKPDKIVASMAKEFKVKAEHIVSPIEIEMYWQVRRASYTLSKFMDKSKRPAAFLEDMTVPTKHIASFFKDIKKLLKKYKVQAAVHGHGGNGHLHFYPLMDFTDEKTPAKITAMAEDFFNTAVKYGGNICGEHNDGIIRTPHLSKLFSKQVLKLFATVEKTFDPEDIFNPGKKVHPRFDIKETMRKIN